MTGGGMLNRGGALETVTPVRLPNVPKVVYG